MQIPIPSRPRSFLSVALFIIICGTGTLAVGIVQLIGVLFWEWHFGWPAAKIIGGLTVIALGYIVLELELMRKENH